MKQVLFLYVFVIGCSFALHSNFLGSTKGAQVYRVVPKDEEELNFLIQNFRSDICDFWSLPRIPGKPVDMMTTGWMVAVLKNILEKKQIHYEIVVEDVQILIDEFRDQNEAALEKSRLKGKKMDWDSYRPYDEITEWMDEIASKFSDLISVVKIGHTFENRPMKMMRMTKGEGAKPVVWIDAGIHGREWIGPATVTFLINELLTNAERYSDLLENVDVYFVPVANPDGYVYSWNKVRLWSKTRSDFKHLTGCVGSDLYRNWESHWNEVENMTNVCSDSYPGSKPFSEAETQHLRDQLLKLSPHVKVYLSLQSYGQYWLSPWSYATAITDDAEDVNSFAEGAVEALAKAKGTRYLFGSTLNRYYSVSGTSIDWVKEVIGAKYSYMIELPDEGKHGFFLPPDKITPVGKEMFEAFKYILKFVRENYGLSYVDSKVEL